MTQLAHLSIGSDQQHPTQEWRRPLDRRHPVRSQLVSPAGQLSDLAVQPLTAFSDCMAGKLRSTRLPPPPASADADGFPLLFVFNLST